LSEVIVVGVGNLLLMDEGVGCWIARRLKKRVLPENVEIEEAGTASFDTLLVKKHIKKLIIVDAVRGGGKPGTVYKIKLSNLPFKDFPLSLHQFTIIDSLNILRSSGRSINDVVVIGIEPAKIEWGLGLSEDVSKKIFKAIDMVLEEVEDACNRDETN